VRYGWSTGTWIVADGAAIFGTGDWLINHHFDVVDGCSFGVGLIALAISDWLYYDATHNYLYPSGDSYNKYLKGQLGLSMYEIKSGGGLQMTWHY
jgi:hypothetical protein